MRDNIPWSDELVDKLNKHQRNRKFHPYTCGNRHEHGHIEYAEKHGEYDHGILIATKDGWICPVCDYTQKWAH